MRHRAGKWLAVLMLASLFLGACEPELPGDVHVDIYELYGREVTLEQVRSAYANADVTPPFYEQTPGTRLYVVVTSFNVPWMPDGVNFEIVRVTIFSWKKTPDGGYIPNPDVKLVRALPSSVERTSDKTTSTKWAASMTATIEALSGTLGTETTSSESYEKIYRSVTSHLNTSGEATWEFEPFLDEPIPGGLHYVAVIVEVQEGSTGNLFHANCGCYFSADSVMGMEGAGNGCTAGDTQWYELP